MSFAPGKNTNKTSNCNATKTGLERAENNARLQALCKKAAPPRY